MSENGVSIKLAIEGVQVVEHGMRRISAAIGSIVTVGASLRRMMTAVSGADEMGKMAKRIGAVTESLSALSYAAKLSDVDMHMLSRGSKELLEWMGKNGQAGKKLTDALVEQSAVISAIEDPTTRAAVAQERFGKAGFEMLPFLLQGPDAIRALMVEAERLGVVTEHQAAISEEYNDSLTKLGFATDALARVTAVALLPTMTSTVTKLTDLVAAMSRFVQTYPAAQRGIEALAGSVAAFGTALALPKIGGMLGLATAAGTASSALMVLGSAFAGFKIGQAIGEMELFGIALNNRVTAMIHFAEEAWLKFKQAVTGEDLSERIRGLQEEMARLVFPQASVVNRPPPAETGIKEARLTKEELEARRKALDERIKLIKSQQDYIKYEIEAGGGIASKEQIETLRSQNATIDELLTARSNLLLQASITSREAVPYNTQDTMDSTANKRDALAFSDPNSIIEQMSRMMREVQNEVGTLAQQIARTFKSVIGGAIDSVSQGISNLIRGTHTWGQALSHIGTGIVNSIIEAFSRMAAEWIVTHVIMKGVAWAFSAAMTAIKAAEVAEFISLEALKTPLLSVNAVLASITSYGAAGWIGLAAVVAALGVGIAAISGAFADGGRPPVGRPALVGERGPELFVPDRPGIIIPNHNLVDSDEGLMMRGIGDQMAEKRKLDIVMVDSRSEARQYLNTSDGEGHIIDIVRRHSRELNI